MTNEEVRKSMEFIVAMEARSSPKIDAQKEAEKRWALSEERWKRSDERSERTEESIHALPTTAEIREREIATLGDKGRATDGRLNALISIVERQISEGRNGKP